MPRDRRLYKLFQDRFGENPAIRLLDFSPSRSLYREIKSKRNIQYFPTDFSNDFIAEYHYDITKIPVGDNFFDAIFCYHILEHIDADRAAMAELFRVLKKGGTVFVQTPFRDGEIFENPAYKTQAERRKHFGQEDHVRIYSIAGLAGRLSDVGFDIEICRFDEENYQGLAKDETVLLLSKK